jgi:hypothetical protein
MPRESGDVSLRYQCEVLVIGSGVSGYCAAIQAGRLGCRTILVEKDAVLGGNSGPDLGVGITGADRYNHFGTETGLIHELQEDAAWAMAFTQLQPGAMPYNISRRNEAIVQEYLEAAGVKVLKRHYARYPLLAPDGRIVGIIAEDLAAFRAVQIDVDGVVIEASGDGEVGALAGAEYDVGSEAQDEFHERSAMPTRSNWVQGTSLVAIAQKTGLEVVFIPPPGLPPFQPRVWQGRPSSWIHHHDRWFSGPEGIRFLYVTEAGGAQDTIRDDGEIYEELLGQLWSEWDHIKNGPHREQASCWDLLWVSPKAGKRESRRFLGDVVLTQTDLEAGRRFEDDIAYGGHDLDDHRPLRAGGNIVAHSVPPLYGIPYRACYSRNVPNLLLAGRLISATHLAHSSTRLMRTGGAIGQAMGIAASLCVRHGCAPRAVYERHLEALQRALLEADGTILARPKSAEGDLARQATASASSELRFNDQEPGEMVPLIAPVGILLWDWAPTLDGLELYLSSQSAQPEPLTVRLLRAKRDRTWKSMEEYEAFGRNDLRDQAFAQLASFEATVPPKHDGWFRIALPEAVTIGAKDSTSDDDRLLICIDGGAALSWALARDRMPIAEAVEHSHMQPEWHQIGAMFTMRLSPAPKLGEASNAINGFYRRFSTGPTNMWMSNPAGGLPQELVLTWETPQTIDEVHLVLDNLCRLRHENPWENATRVAPHLIKAYELLWRQAWRGDGDAWKRLVQEEHNHHRFRQHSFPAVTTDRLCLRVLAVHGGLEGARVYSVRVPAKTSR